MLEKLDSVVRTFTGVIPAEPGWRVIISDGKIAYSIPVIGWAWERHVWRQDQTEAATLDAFDGEPLVIAEDGGRISSIGYVCWCLSGLGEGKFVVKRLLAPGKTFNDSWSDGWTEVPLDSAERD